MNHKPSKLVGMFTAAFLIRLTLVLYATWQDENFEVKYTDIDYVVVSDGARYLTQDSSPYLRSTYRYTPLLAYVFTGNIYFFRSFGKLLMAAIDLIIGWLILLILRHLKLQGFVQNTEYSSYTYVAIWLFNPMVINVSTRGNSESLVSLLVLATIYCILKGRIVIGALIYGLSVHFKIYPLIYSLALFFYIGYQYRNPKEQKTNMPQTSTKQSQKSKKKAKVVDTPTQIMSSDNDTKAERNFFGILEFFNKQSLLFAFISASVFLALTGLFYVIYDWEFLYETYLYHLVREDNRHNFSVYFYHIYLSTSRKFLPSTIHVQSVILTKLQAFALFIPQVSLILVFTAWYYRSIIFCIFLQTYSFVVFNKVVTVQYFIWYFSLLPLVLPYSNIKVKWNGIKLGVLWFVSQLAWLNFGYELEFLGKNRFYHIWIASIIYFIVQVYIMIEFIVAHKTSRVTITQTSKIKNTKE